MSYEFLLQLIANGIVIGLIYGLIATGLALLFGILHIVNFAHGEMVMLAMYAIAIVVPFLGGSYVASFAIIVLAAALLGWLVSGGLLAALSSKRSDMAVFEKSLLLTLGLSIILLNGVQYVFTATPMMVTTDIPVGAFMLGPVRLSYGHAMAGAVAIVVFVGLYLFLTRTNSGRALRAVAQNRDAALMIGLDPERVARQAITLGIVLCAVGGAVLIPLYVFQPIVGQALLLKAFAIVIIGGMGNVLGAAVVALGLGILESVVGGFASIVWQNAIAFIGMIAVLLVRPQGLFALAMRKG
ncbi:branched-chain amino acid ABC transporter permease [Mesorhizobium australicum]|uniref:Branched-chain amino acid transport system permease protein n=1 Tax=Mesorhizobium australicum TaxID=536018 RepID=A0A1X7NFN1_9HYPH|nr:branched-chain amino acid ABC transporter permease [Mesorhizobium australicum]SMH36554.1 branched-chain amino acid transport system permease protein [Mesorhizobium australicum]